MKQEHGHMVVFAGLMMGVMALVALLIANVAGTANVQARAQTAADAAALAGVQLGEDAAGDAAERNRAQLVEYAPQGNEILVKVRIGDRTARARAAVVGGLE